VDIDMRSLLQLEPHGPDTFVGTGPQYPWGGLFGGQIVAQALRAAAMTVEPQFRPHSLHAYFIRRGDPSEPIRFEVERLRNGGSFCTRAVVCRQSTGAILNMSASFQVGEEAVDLQAATRRDLPGPDGLDEDTWNPPLFRRRFTKQDGKGEASAWLRTAGELGDDAVAHACALAFMSDDMPTDSVRMLHPHAGNDWESWFGTSLDHAIWFHRPIDATRWHLHDFRCESLINGRGLSRGRVFAEDGTHLATVTQEVLLRKRR
jgi:acyl-CoA thioesterase II